MGPNYKGYAIQELICLCNFRLLVDFQSIKCQAALFFHWPRLHERN